MVPLGHVHPVSDLGSTPRSTKLREGAEAPGRIENLRLMAAHFLPGALGSAMQALGGAGPVLGEVELEVWLVAAFWSCGVGSWRTGSARHYLG